MSGEGRGRWLDSPVTAQLWCRRGDDYVLEAVNGASVDVTDGAAAHFVGKTLREMFPDDDTLPALIHAVGGDGETRDVVTDYESLALRTRQRVRFVASSMGTGRVLVQACPVDAPVARLSPAFEALRNAAGRHLLERTEAAVYTWAIVGDDFELVDFNQWAVHTSGGRVLRLIGRRASELYGDGASMPALLARAAEGEHVVEPRFVYEMVTTEEHRVLHIDALRIGGHVLVMTEDRTELSEAEARTARRERAVDEREQELSVSQATLDALARQDLVGLLRTDDSATLLEANRGWRLMHGAQLQEPTWLGLVHEDDRERVGGALASTRGGAVTRIEYRSVAVPPRWLLADIVTLPPSRELLVVTHDVTLQRHARDRAQQAEARLRRAERMETIGRLAGGIAHDFNNVLAAMTVLADMIRHETTEAAVRQDAEEILSIARRGSALARQLLAIGRRQPLSPIALDVGDLVEDMRGMLARLIGEDVSLETVIAEGTPPAFADQSQIEQVVLNLVVNARDAMPQGGRLLIAVAVADPDVVLQAAPQLTPAPGAYVSLSVTDEGIGIGPDSLDTIFEPFTTTKAGQGGSGLGLATVHAIAMQAGGHVTVASTPGSGTTFTVLLPTTSGAVAPTEEDGPRDVDRSDVGGRVLVVEDGISLRRGYVRLLRAAGFEVYAAENADEAERVVASLDEPIDVLVTDVVMPGRSGVELAFAMRSHQPGLPVVFVSALRGHDPTAFESLGPGQRLLVKPVEGAVLVDAVRGFLGASGSG